MEGMFDSSGFGPASAAFLAACLARRAANLASMAVMPLVGRDAVGESGAEVGGTEVGGGGAGAERGGFAGVRGLGACLGAGAGAGCSSFSAFSSAPRALFAISENPPQPHPDLAGFGEAAAAGVDLGEPTPHERPEAVFGVDFGVPNPKPNPGVPVDGV